MNYYQKNREKILNEPQWWWKRKTKEVLLGE